MPRWASFFAPTVRFLLQTEIHAYAFAIAASLLLSFFPFLVLLLSICLHLLHWRGAADVLYLALGDFLPSDAQLFDFLRSNLRAAVASRGRVELFSIILLLLASNGIFEPLEVALNRVWGISKNRSYWRNQWISFGMTMLCGVLALVSTLFTAMNRTLLESLAGPLPGITRWVSLAAFKAAALPVSITILFLVYWLLPNGPIPWRPALGAAILSGMAVEAAKILYLRIWPWLDFRHAYGPFFISVTLVVWGVISSLVVLAGAEISARGHGGAAPADAPGGILTLGLSALPAPARSASSQSENVPAPDTRSPAETRETRAADRSPAPDAPALPKQN